MNDGIADFIYQKAHGTSLMIFNLGSIIFNRLQMLPFLRSGVHLKFHMPHLDFWMKFNVWMGHVKSQMGPSKTWNGSFEDNPRPWMMTCGRSIMGQFLHVYLTLLFMHCLPMNTKPMQQDNYTLSQHNLNRKDTLLQIPYQVVSWGCLMSTSNGRGSSFFGWGHSLPDILSFTLSNAHLKTRHGWFGAWFSEESTGNIAKRRLLVTPYGPEIQTEFC